jgi:hypothetical protein
LPLTGGNLKNSKIIELTVLGLWLLIAIVLLLRTKSQDEVINPINNNSIVEANKNYEIKKITVFDANTFDITLKDDLLKRISACLSVKSSLDSKKKIIELFNHAQNPVVSLKQKNSDGKWLVEIFLDHDGKKVQMTEWLKNNNLVYQ